MPELRSLTLRVVDGSRYRLGKHTQQKSNAFRKFECSLYADQRTMDPDMEEYRVDLPHGLST